jgi:hypothetical protein
MPKQLLIAACTLLVLAGCSKEDDARENARLAVKSLLKDPGSAEFTNERVLKDASGNPTVVCGEVNAKNAFGGYVGAQKFFDVIHTGSGTVMVRKADRFDDEFDKAYSAAGCGY